MTSTAKNSLSGAAQLLLTAGLTFVSIPVFIGKLGAEAYGAFAIVTLAGNLNLFANLGLNTALLKFLSVQGKSTESDYDIAVTLGLLLAIMLPLSALAVTFQAGILQKMLGLSAPLYTQIAGLYRCVVAANLVLLLGQTFTTVLDAQQRMYLTNFFQFIYSLLYWGGLIAVVSLGYTLNEAGWVILGAALIWLGLVMVTAWRSWGGLQLTGLPANARRIARKQLAVGANVYASGLLSFLFEPMTKVLVSRLIGVTEVGYLEIAYKIRSQLWALVTKVTYPLFPQIARETDSVRLGRFIGSLQSRMLLVIGPFLLLFALTLPDLLRLWLPNANALLTTATLSITSTYLLGTIALPTYYFLVSRQHERKTVWLQAANVLINGGVILLTYRSMGMYGVVLANSLAILASLGLSLYYQKTYLHQLHIQLGVGVRIGVPVSCFSGLTYLVGQLLTEPVHRLELVAFAAVVAVGGACLANRRQLKSWLA